MSVKHDELTGSWEIPYKTRYGHNVIDCTRFGTDRIETLHILERTLNMRTIAVKDEIKSPTGGTSHVINKEETVLALEKQQNLIREFQNWVWKDPARKERLETIFENRFSCVRQRHFDGSFLEFPDMDPSISLYPYQKNAVARILFTPNTLLAHEVGAGKTYIMIAAGMELRRMQLSKKNLYVVPNNIVGQWKSIFQNMYPAADILVVTPGNFKPSKRQDVLVKIRDNDYDGIIMAYSCFEMFRLSDKENLARLQEIKQKIEDALSDPSRRTGKLSKEREKILKELAGLTCSVRLMSADICFDELGITRIFVDEAHNFKNVPLQTKITKVLGISAAGSVKCKAMMDKVRCVQAAGGGVVLATGTPVTNSVTDAFVMQKYLQNGELVLLDLQHFDSWIGMFAEQKTEFEIDVDTSGYRMATRFSRFHNLPELSALLGQVADFHQNNNENELPDFDGYTDSLIARTPKFKDFLDDISDRAEAVRQGYVPRNVDNMLMITTDGRKGALDLRLVKPNSTFTWQSKVARCAENVFDIYRKTMAEYSVQLIFCDTSTPKAGFNLYDELRRLLEGMGIPGNEIAYIHDAESDKRRQQLFSLVCKGIIRVLIGSTFKLGLGVNLQDKLIALHHLDVPWRPADMTQREGRILRQGNENRKVEIYRYITEGSFDAYSWQLLETKQRFISDLLSGSYSGRSGSDIDDTVLSYAEVKALAIGNSLVKKRVETYNELSRILALQRKTLETRQALEQELAALPAKIELQKKRITAAEADAMHYQIYMESLPTFVDTKEKKKAEEARRTLRQQLFKAVHEYEYQPKENVLTTYRGFRIILPANMDPRKPFIWLEKEGHYYIELGDSETGGLIRIDHFLEQFRNYIEDRKAGLQVLFDRKKQIRNELSVEENFSEKIDELREELKNIDQKLEVKNS